MNIRPAQSEDVEQLAKLCTQLGYAATASELAPRLALLQSQADHVVYVAHLHQELPVGWIHAQRCSLLIAATQVVILGLVVDQSYRRFGVGRLLIQAVEQWSLSQDCRSILVRSNVLRSEAHRFYEALGYRLIKQSMVFCKTLRDPLS